MNSTPTENNYTSKQDLLNRAEKNNHFFGAITKVKSNYYVKELLSELVLPLLFIEYEMPPLRHEFNKTFYFRLIRRAEPWNLAAELIEKRFIGISEDMQYHLHHGTTFDAEVDSITHPHILISIPFFSVQARIDILNCKTELKESYRKLKTGDRLRIKLYRIDGKAIYVKLAGYTF
jgi:hypothetical protein